MEIDGLPFHGLIVHAAVVLIPLTALLAIGFAVVPGWRWLTRWPTALASLLCVAIAYLSTSSGESLEHQRHLEQLVRVHSERGELLAKLTVALALVAVVAGLLLPGRSGLASGRGAVASRTRYADWVLPVLLVVVAVVVLVQTYLTGEAGARAVWGQ